ncbi:hypothetical protein U1Q18_047407 [Sarracenia purpurea var. burkii]
MRSVMAEMSPKRKDDKGPSRNTSEKNPLTGITEKIKISSVVTKLDSTLSKLQIPIKNCQIPQMSFEDVWNSKPHFRKTESELSLLKMQEENYRKSMREQDEKITQLTKQLKDMRSAYKNESVSVNIQISAFAKVPQDKNVPTKVIKQLDLNEYEPEEIIVTIKDGYVIIQGKHEIDPVVLPTTSSDQVTVTIFKRSHSSEFHSLKSNHQKDLAYRRGGSTKCNIQKFGTFPRM